MELAEYNARTVQSMGWSGVKNGPLLQRMVDAGFHAFITIDKQLRYQQNIRARGIAIIQLGALSNRTPDLLPLVPPIRSALDRIKPGELILINLQ